MQHSLPFRFYIRLQRHQYGCAPPTALRDETPYQPRVCTTVQDGREIVWDSSSTNIESSHGGSSYQPFIQCRAALIGNATYIHVRAQWTAIHVTTVEFEAGAGRAPHNNCRPTRFLYCYIMYTVALPRILPTVGTSEYSSASAAISSRRSRESNALGIGPRSLSMWYFSCMVLTTQYISAITESETYAQLSSVRT